MFSASLLKMSVHNTSSVLRLNGVFVLILFLFRFSFHLFIQCCCHQHHGAPLIVSDVLSYLNTTFTMFFTFECALKLVSFGCRVNNINNNNNNIFGHSCNLMVQPFWWFWEPQNAGCSMPDLQGYVTLG